MQRGMMIVALALGILGSVPIGAEDVTLRIALLDVPSCVDARGLQARGTALRVGGAEVQQIETRMKLLGGAWSGWGKQREPFHAMPKGKVITYDTQMKIVYPGDLEPVEVVSSIDDGREVTVKLWNERRSFAIRVYIGDTADYRRLDCLVMDNGVLTCKNTSEV